VPNALEQSLHDPRSVGAGGLVHHSDRGVQFVSIKHTERLTEAGLVPSVGSVGDSYDNALAETINGLYKAEVIWRRGPWRTLGAVEFATLERVGCFNSRRPLEPIGKHSAGRSGSRLLCEPRRARSTRRPTRTIQPPANPGRFKEVNLRHLTTLIYVDAVAKAGSIRQAAEALSITQSALNRRILALEDELGVPIFERLPRGVRLNTAGELLIHHIRNQMADFERMRSQIADLSGVRRGHVSVACSQALLPFFMPTQVASYRRLHEGVSFSIAVRDREAAERSLLDYSADLAVIFEPIRTGEIQTIQTVRQAMMAVMSIEHPLAKRKRLRLADCIDYPLALPSKSYGVRSLIEKAAIRLKLTLSPMIQSDSFEYLRHYVLHEAAIAFQITIGLPEDPVKYGLATVPIESSDLPNGTLHLAQLRHRVLPIAAARFLDQLQKELADR
jgi:DNA-binding transcriptional LysR family regulator